MFYRRTRTISEISPRSKFFSLLPNRGIPILFIATIQADSGRLGIALAVCRTRIRLPRSAGTGNSAGSHAASSGLVLPCRSVESLFRAIAMAKRLYVGNLKYTVTSEELQELFEPYGTVSSAQVLSDRETGRSRGFGFVEMVNDDEALARSRASTARITTVGGSRSMRRGPAPRAAVVVVAVAAGIGEAAGAGMAVVAAMRRLLIVVPSAGLSIPDLIHRELVSASAVERWRRASARSN